MSKNDKPVYFYCIENMHQEDYSKSFVKSSEHRIFNRCLVNNPILGYQRNFFGHDFGHKAKFCRLGL